MSAIPITLFWPDRLARAPQRGVRLEATWEELLAWLERPVVTADKASAGGFALARFVRDERRLANVEAVGAIGLDGDETGTPAGPVADALSNYRAAVYTTHSHSPDAPRWRAIVALSRVVTRDEHRQIVGLAHEHFAAAGLRLDPACKDASRLWYVPAVRCGAPYELHLRDGAPLDVDAALRTARELEEARRAAQEREAEAARARLAVLGDVRERARRYLAAMPPAIAGSGGHVATYRAALAMVRGFALAEPDALALMREFNARCEPPWSARELERKVAEAAKARDVGIGFLLGTR